MESFVRYSWNDIEEAVECIVQQLQDLHAEFDYIVAIAKGGLIPAVMLADYLQKPLIIVEASHYVKGSTERKSAVDVFDFNLPTNGDTFLLVDDVYDTGATIEEVAGTMEHKGVDGNNIYVAVIVNKNQEAKAPLFVAGIEADKYVWQIFPWEKKEFKEVFDKVIK